MLAKPAMRYFNTVGFIETKDIFEPLRAAKSDEEIAAIVAQMDQEGKGILGHCFKLHFDRTVMSRDIAKRIRLTVPTRTIGSIKPTHN